MCSIVGILNIQSDHQELRSRALQMSKVQRHRGPDWSGIYDHELAILAHERLSIVDINTGAQPFSMRIKRISSPSMVRSITIKSSNIN